jgi:PhzF family phenazine biosynthesis protein
MVGRTVFDYVVEIDSEAALRSLAPDMTVLAGIPYRGVIVTAPSVNPRYDFVSRFFAPGLGIPEDPVTGSAHCGLGPYWGTRLSKDELVGYQASSRGGTVLVRIEGNRVHLGGKAVTVVRGEILY